MNRFKGKRFARYSVDEIECFIRRNPGRFEEKHVFEGLVGCVLARASELTGDEAPQVGWLVKGNYPTNSEVPQPELFSISFAQTLDDRDFDIHLQWSQVQSIVQVTRFEEHRAGCDPFAGFMELIKKKSLIPVDDYLILAVLGDYGMVLPFQTLNDKLLANCPPYKSIYVINQVDQQIETGRFDCIEVYPELLTSTVSLNL